MFLVWCVAAPQDDQPLVAKGVLAAAAAGVRCMQAARWSRRSSCGRTRRLLQVVEGRAGGSRCMHNTVLHRHSTCRTPEGLAQHSSCLCSRADEAAVGQHAHPPTLCLRLPAAAPGTDLSPEVLYRLAERLSAATQPQYMQLLLPISQHTAGACPLRQSVPSLTHQPALRPLNYSPSIIWP